jgi:hypothetical protein
MGALSIINIDGLVKSGNKYKDHHPSNPSAFKLPIKSIGAIKSFFPFLLAATKFSLFPRFPGLSPETFFPLFAQAQTQPSNSSNPDSSINTMLLLP